MRLNNQLAVLAHLYEIYDNLILVPKPELGNERGKALNMACKRYCAACCTRNVTLTTLEGYKIINYLTETGKSDLLEKFRAEAHKKRFQPQITTNQFAQSCMQGADIPEEEESEAAWGECPFLQNNECPIYPARPFGCRCFVSEQNCSEQGTAYVSPFVITVNNVFLQYIEHIDVHGAFGNLTDVLLFMAYSENRRNYEISMLKGFDTPLIPNYPLKILMIPPEHRTEIKPILEAIAEI